MSRPHADDLAHVRAEFERWRAARSGRGRIPDRLWRLAIALLNQFSSARVCRELRLSAAELKKRRQALAAELNVPPTFLTLRAVDLTAAAERLSPKSTSTTSELRVELIRTDGARLALQLPPTDWAHVEALCAAFLRA